MGSSWVDQVKWAKEGTGVRKLVQAGSMGSKRFKFGMSMRLSEVRLGLEILGKVGTAWN